MAKWMTAEKVRARLRHAVVCRIVTGKTLERTTKSNRARAGSVAIVDRLATSGANLYASGVFCFADAVLS